MVCNLIVCNLFGFLCFVCCAMLEIAAGVKLLQGVSSFL